MKTRKITGGAAQGRTPAGTPSIRQRWNAARASGERTFDPGVECVNGHASLRWTSSGICIVCKRARDNAYNAAHPEEHRARARASAARRPDEVKEYLRRYYASDPDKAKRRARDWELAHPVEKRSRRRKWHAKNRTRLNAKSAARRAANPEPARAASRAWKKANPAKVHADYCLRRAIEIGAQVGDRRAYARFVKWARKAPGLKCYWCRRRTSPSERHLDHIIPLARGGADAVENLCVACPPCNYRKNAKLPEEFTGQAEMRFA